MKCIYCKQKGTEVRNSRLLNGLLGVWRRRYCPTCKMTFTTKEFGFADNLFVIKRNGKRQRFVYEKLLVSIFTSIDKGRDNDNGSGALIAKKITDSAIYKMLNLKTKDVSTKLVIEIVFTELVKINPYFGERYMYHSEYRTKVVSDHLKAIPRPKSNRVY